MSVFTNEVILDPASLPLQVDGSSVTQPVSGTITANAGTGNFNVTQSSGSNLHVNVDNFPGAGTISATVTSVASSATSVTLLASNASRKGAMIYNDSTKNLYIKFGATASSSSFTVLLTANSFFEIPYPTYTGQIDGVWASVNGNARITELS